MATNGTIIQYKFLNNSFSNVLSNTPSINSPYPGLTKLFCYDAGNNGYSLNIKPHSSNNKIQVQFKVKYASSDLASANLTIGVVCSTNGGVSYSVVGQDTFFGTTNICGQIYDVYMFNCIHSPNTTDNAIYKMFFQIENTNSDGPIGLIGDTSSSNCIILEELMFK
ncbi:MAG: hypothetical protein EBY20_00900 [Alphaproteobacteria bacterium]|uniref:Uncharacterized protein n=1 Tax=viral metagenome TaxID=1070528 RepID=A0A6C0HQJ3_9ZZZZ|nr:hypothetical protein [Alphaproteobacteria bacterium]